MISHHRLFRTIFRLLFNFQGSSLLSFRKPLYYITSFSICQEVFEIFFRIFSFSRHPRFTFRVLSLVTFIFYHISLLLSIPFSKFFQEFRSFLICFGQIRVSFIILYYKKSAATEHTAAAHLIQNVISSTMQREKTLSGSE